MQSSYSRYVMIARRWAWLIIMGVLICSVFAYGVSKVMKPVYQATAILYVNFHSASPYENTNAAMTVLPTYAQFITNPAILQPVAAQHKGLTVSDLAGMITAKPVTSTQNIEIDVQNADPKSAMDLANEVSQSFALYANTQLSASTQIFPAVFPADPIKPNPKSNALLGALVGLGLALALIVIFEWMDDRCTSPEQIQELLGADYLASIPKLGDRELKKEVERVPGLAEPCRLLAASVSAYRVRKPFKLLMVTSAIAGEGKSTIAVNLASFLALAGRRVLLVDADFRRSALKGYFQLDDGPELASMLLDISSGNEVDLAGQPTEIPGLRVLVADVANHNPAELLQSSLAHSLFDRFNELKQFDYVIFDTPPLLPVADAQILASYIPVTIIVVDATRTPRKLLTRAKAALSRAGTTTLGMVINRSMWPEISAIRQYLNEVEHRRPTKRANAIPLLPETPRDPVNEASRSMEHDETIVLPSRGVAKSKSGK